MNDVSNTTVFAVDLADPEIFLALQRGSSKRRAWLQTHRAGRAELMEPGCAGSAPEPGLLQPCLSTVGAPIWISALQSRPSPAQGISELRFPGQGRV